MKSCVAWHTGEGSCWHDFRQAGWEQWRRSLCLLALVGAAVISGCGTNPSSISLSQSSITFGTQVVGTTSATMTVTVTNTSSNRLHTVRVTSITKSGASPGEFNLLLGGMFTCPAMGDVSLMRNESCTFGVEFAPTSATSSITNALIVVTSTANSGGTLSLSLSGTPRMLQPVVNLSPTSLAFANQVAGTTSAPMTVTVRNSGDADLIVTSITKGGANPADFNLLLGGAFTCPATGDPTLTPNASCTFGVAFAPQARGPSSAEINVASNGGGPGNVDRLTVTGFGLGPIANLDMTSIAFGNQMVGSISADTTVTLSNNGDADLTVASIAKGGANPADFNLLLGGAFTCPTGGNPTLIPNASCTFGVNFAPVLTGLKAADVSVTSNASGSPHQVTLSGTGTATAVPRGVLERVSLASVDSMGNSAEGNGAALSLSGTDYTPSVSSDGRFVAFGSAATNLVDENGDGSYTDDTNNVADCFVRDRQTQQTVRVSLGHDATGATIQSTATCGGVIISGDGRHVAFFTAAGLVPNDTNNVEDVYVRDTCQGAAGCTPRTHLISVGVESMMGTKILGNNRSGGGAGVNSGLTLSADGRFVGFFSLATNLASPVATLGIYVHDRDADGDGMFDEEELVMGLPALSTNLVSLNENGLPAISAGLSSPAISAAGRFVVFMTQAFVVTGTTANRNHTYVRDTCQGAPPGCTPSSILISKDDAGNEDNGGTIGRHMPQRISADGRFVSFISLGTNLGGATLAGNKVFLHDRDINDDDVLDQPGDFRTVLVSLRADGMEILNANVRGSTVSGSGRLVAFSSTSDFDPNPPSNTGHVYLRDTCLGPNAPVPCTPVTFRLSALPDATLTPGNQASSNPWLSSNGESVAFLSLANNFNVMPADMNGVQDIYLAGTGFTDPPVPPQVAGLNPSNLAAGASGVDVIVRGAGFTSASVVYWNGSPRTTFFVHGGKLLARIRASDIASPGTAQIHVVNSAGQPAAGASRSPAGGTSSGATFTVN